MKSAKEILGFNDTWLILIGVPVVTLTTNAMMFTALMLEDPATFLQRCGLVGLIYTIVFWATFRAMLIFFKRRFPAPADFTKRILLQTGAVFAVFFILKQILDPLLHPIIASTVGDEKAHSVGMSISSLMVTFLVLGIYETTSFYNQLQQSLLEKERLLKENIRGQLESLRNQVNPHFFFNSLNTLSYLIPEAPAKAVNFVQKLSKAYRYILEIREKELVSLEEELGFLDSYTCLLKERFGENLNISIQVPKEFYRHRIVPLCLQMLFENAIKHNVVSSQHPLTIEVFVEHGDRLVVRNNLQRKNQDIPSTKIGLDNICSRYKLVSDREVEVAVSPTAFSVVLPMLGI
ncbi:MAG: histidine kinase [Lewinellaceae bacterium]|nr:histidine kinase [Saprospiraceae bacterium]MCB9338413.1 histidine kinase [Lewinellaceae bacterium]